MCGELVGKKEGTRHGDIVSVADGIGKRRLKEHECCL